MAAQTTGYRQGLPRPAINATQTNDRKYTEDFVDAIYAEAVEWWNTAVRKTEIQFAVFLTHRANAAVDPVLALRMILDRHRGQPQA
jgi:hypothetical protein